MILMRGGCKDAAIHRTGTSSEARHHKQLLSHRGRLIPTGHFQQGAAGAQDKSSSRPRNDPQDSAASDVQGTFMIISDGLFIASAAAWGNILSIPILSGGLPVAGLQVTSTEDCHWHFLRRLTSYD